MSKPAFAGFPIELLHFMHELQANNNRDWFNAHKSRYEKFWLEPALGFIDVMQAPLARFSPAFVASPKRVGGSLMRIYRDTRFSNDKQPYKTNVGIQFRHKSGKDVHAPGIYFHLDTEQPFLGVGLWRPDKHALSAIRQAIVEDTANYKRALKGTAFVRDFERVGDQLKRVPRGYDRESPMADELKRTDHIAISHLTLDDCLSPELPKLVSSRLRGSKSYLQWLCQALDIEF